MREKIITATRRIRVQKKKCEYCGKEFWGPSRKIYCSKGCSNLAAYYRHAERYRQQRRERYSKQKEQAVKK